MVLTVTYISVIMLARFGPWSTTVSERFPWSEIEIPGIYIESGTYGLERSPDFYWIRDRQLVFRLENPLNEPAVIDLSIKFGPTVCGNQPSVSLGRGWPQSGTIGAGSIIREQVVLRSDSYLRLFVRINNKSCRVIGDPRVFLGSVMGMTIHSW